MTLKIQEIPEKDRPRERLETLGAAALTDSELIGILLRTGRKGQNAIEMGQELIKQHGSLGALARCSAAELKKMPGIKGAKGVQLAAAFELGNRLAREHSEKRRMDSPQLIYDLLGTEMRMLSKELLRVVLLDAKLCLKKVENVSLGSLNESLAHPREILRSVISEAAYGFILVHNHPSGDPTPSEADRRLTIRLHEAAKLLQVQMLDHVIIGAPNGGRQPYFSFRESGVI